MAIVNEKNIKLEREMDAPKNWESNVIYTRSNGVVAKVVIEDDKEGDE